MGANTLRIPENDRADPLTKEGAVKEQTKDQASHEEQMAGETPGQ